MRRTSGLLLAHDVGDGLLVARKLGAAHVGLGLLQLRNTISTCSTQRSVIAAAAATRAGVQVKTAAGEAGLDLQPRPAPFGSWRGPGHAGCRGPWWKSLRRESGKTIILKQLDADAGMGGGSTWRGGRRRRSLIGEGRKKDGWW